MNKLLLFVMILLFTSYGFTQTDIFWANYGSNVGRVALDGSNLQTIVPSGSGFSVATDMTNEKLYYNDGTSAIMRCDFDGSNSEQIATVNTEFGMAIDETNGKLYWTEFNLNEVKRSDLDGSNIETIITGVSYPSGITVDPVNNKLYVITYNSTAVYRADLDGSNFSSIITGISGQGVAIDVDGANGFIYYTCRNANIYRAETDGSNAVAVYTAGAAIQGLDLHLGDGKMYWADAISGSINKADLDGSNVEVVTTSASGAWHIALGLGTIQNTAPVITSADAISVEENQTATLTVTATDADAGDAQTYSISGGADELLFDINASTGDLSFVAAPDFETPTDDGTDNTYIVEVTVTDNGSLTDVQTVTVTVTNVSEFTDNAPVITSADAVSVEENQTATLTVTATDADAGDSQTYSISGGADELLFDINASTGDLTFVAAPDFETPTDDGTDNTYIVEVTVTDNGSLTDVQTVTVTVTNVSEFTDNAPVITSADAVSVEENQTATLTVMATDADVSDFQAYSISGGADELLFSIAPTSGVLTFTTAPDFETPTDDGTDNTYIVEVTVTDNGSLTDVQIITVTVTDVDESLNIESINNIEIGLYPNPSIGVYQLQYGQELNNSEISIADINGKVIYQNTISETIDISSNVQGVYFMTITNLSKVQRFKLVIKK